MPEAERFEAQYTPEPNTGCWLWTGAAHAERNGNAKLTDADVQAIRCEHQAGAPVKQLAAKFGVNRSHVWRITRGHNRVA